MIELEYQEHLNSLKWHYDTSVQWLGTCVKFLGRITQWAFGRTLANGRIICLLGFQQHRKYIKTGPQRSAGAIAILTLMMI